MNEPDAESTAAACTACQRPLRGHFYTCNEQRFCTECKLAAQPAPRLHWSVAFVRAAVTGATLACLSAIANFLVVYFTQYELAVVWIFLAVCIAAGVRWGSENRSSLIFRLQAVFLTYVAIGMSLTILCVAWSINPPQDGGEPPGPALPGLSALAPAASPTPTLSATPLPESSATPRHGASPHPGASATPEAGETPVSLAGTVFAGVLLSLVGIFGLPILWTINAPVSGLIYLFAFHQAWKSATPQVMEFEGPYPLVTAGPPPPSETPAPEQ
jgi:hypothetical protein